MSPRELVPVASASRCSETCGRVSKRGDTYPLLPINVRPIRRTLLVHHDAIEEVMNPLADLLPMRLQCEMPRVVEVHFGIG